MLIVLFSKRKYNFFSDEYIIDENVLVKKYAPELSTQESQHV